MANQLDAKMVPGETLAGMEESKQVPFDWADTPWTVAALLGVWGVFMGVEEFFLANVFMVLAGASCTVRLYKDSIRTRPRRKAVFVLGLAIIIAIVGVDIYLTAKKKDSAEARNQEIPALKDQIGTLQGNISTLQGTISTLGTDRKTDEKISGQKLEDIKQQNNELQKSVQTKDAALVSIAKDQYALNFFPQILISTLGSSDTMYVQNNGKTNIETYRIVIANLDVPSASKVGTVAPGAALTYQLSDEGRAQVLRDCANGNGKTSYPGTVYLSTLDNRRYHMDYSWYFQVKDGKIDKSYMSDGAIVEDKETKRP